MPEISFGTGVPDESRAVQFYRYDKVVISYAVVAK
jgi:hypothetical protein